MQWIHHQDGPEQELQKWKISSQEERDTNNAWTAIGKEGYLEDPSKETDKGKSSHASSVGNQVILHGIADRNAMAIKVPHEIIKDQQDPLETIRTLRAPGKSNKKGAPSGL
jgi:hypothetical protein